MVKHIRHTDWISKSCHILMAYKKWSKVQKWTDFAYLRGLSIESSSRTSRYFWGKTKITVIFRVLGNFLDVLYHLSQKNTFTRCDSIISRRRNWERISNRYFRTYWKMSLPILGVFFKIYYVYSAWNFQEFEKSDLRDFMQTLFKKEDMTWKEIIDKNISLLCILYSRGITDPYNPV